MLGRETTTWAHPVWQWGAGSGQWLSLGTGLENPPRPPSPPRASAAPFARAGETAPGFVQSQVRNPPLSPSSVGDFLHLGTSWTGVPGEEEEELLPGWVPSGSPSVQKPCPGLACVEVGLWAPVGWAIPHAHGDG